MYWLNGCFESSSVTTIIVIILIPLPYSVRSKKRSKVESTKERSKVKTSNLII